VSILSRLPPLLLVAVALHQIWLVEREGLSAWCGGGFGMFSTTDGWGTRHLHAVAEGAAFRASLEIPSDLEEDLQSALALPTQERLLGLARALAERTDFDLERPRAIRIDVFARRHDPRTLAPHGELLRSAELRLDAPAPSP
jgi:hypothetical protein